MGKYKLSGLKDSSTVPEGGYRQVLPAKDADRGELS